MQKNQVPKRSKVVLYNPQAVFFDMPLALLAVGSALPAHRYELVIVDGRLYRNPTQVLLEACEDALCLGVTALTGGPLRDAIKATQAVKNRFPHLTTVWGGWHPSLFPRETLQDEPAVDVAVYGQGEVTFRKIADHLRDGSPLDGVAGLAFRRPDGEIVRNPPRLLEDMNNLPPVNYDLIEVEAYYRKKGQRQFDYISSTGCRFRCSFCADPFVFKRGWTGIEPERMGEELAYWKKRYPFDDINFQDETFFTKAKRVRGVAEAFLESNLQTTWAGTMRADQGCRMPEELFDLCKKSGLRRALVGVESGSQEMMDWLQKDIKLEQVYVTARRCRDRDIGLIFPFIVGFPNETDKSIQASLRMAMELNAMHPAFETPIFYFKPYPGSQITQEVVRQGYELPGTMAEWADFDYIGSSGPWVSEAKYRRIEQFKFYNRIAWRNGKWWMQPLRWVARQRLRAEFYGLPLEKFLAEQLRPQEQLS